MRAVQMWSVATDVAVTFEIDMYPARPLDNSRCTHRVQPVPRSSGLTQQQYGLLLPLLCNTLPLVSVLVSWEHRK